MSREVDVSDAGSLEDDDLQYAVQRDMLTREQLEEVGLDTPEKVAAFLAGDRVDPADKPYSGNHLVLSDEEVALIEKRRAKAEAEADATKAEDRIKVSTAVDEDEDEEETGDYEGWTNDDLRAELASRDLSVDGNKADLLARLQEDDAAKA
jgi:hypothetical protein